MQAYALRAEDRESPLGPQPDAVRRQCARRHDTPDSIHAALYQHRKKPFHLQDRLRRHLHASVVMPLLESPVTLIEASGGHRWDSPPKIMFAPDSPLDGGGFELPVPRGGAALNNTPKPNECRCFRSGGSNGAAMWTRQVKRTAGR